MDAVRRGTIWLTPSPTPTGECSAPLFRIHMTHLEVAQIGAVAPMQRGKYGVPAITGCDTP